MYVPIKKTDFKDILKEKTCKGYSCIGSKKLLLMLIIIHQHVSTVFFLSRKGTFYLHTEY